MSYEIALIKYIDEAIRIKIAMILFFLTNGSCIGPLPHLRRIKIATIIAIMMGIHNIDIPNKYSSYMPIHLASLKSPKYHLHSQYPEEACS